MMARSSLVDRIRTVEGESTMTLSEQLERLLPRLRGFARASTRDADLADECVEDAIKRLLGLPRQNMIETGVGYQFHFYRLVEEALCKKAGGSFEKRAWRALILVHVEDFSVSETAHILGVDSFEVRKLVRRAEDAFEYGEQDKLGS